MVDVHDDPIEVVPSRYAEWRGRYRSERDRVRAALAEAGLADRIDRIEHVGSTAVPNLAAKYVVDLDIVVDDDAVTAAAAALTDALGGTPYENGEDWQFVAREADGQRFDDHVFARSAPNWRVSVATRAVLRDRPDLRREYEQVKVAAAVDADDLGAYSRAKTDVVGRILAAAREGEYGPDFAVPDPATVGPDGE